MKTSTYLKHVNFVTVFLLKIVVACDSNENKQRVTVDGHVNTAGWLHPNICHCFSFPSQKVKSYAIERD